MLGFLQGTRMPAELSQWITPAMFILGFLYLDRSIRNVRTESRQEIKDLRQEMKDVRQEMKDLRQDMKDLRKDFRVEIVNLRDHMDAQNEALRDRMGRIEGTLDVLRDFFVHNGRGTAA